MFGRRQKPTVESVEESWSISQGRHENRPILARFNKAYADTSDRSEYAIQIGVAIPVNAPDGRGWPAGDENEQLQVIEDEVVRTAAGRAVLVGVLTVKGVRELVLYSREGEWIEGFHQELQRSITTHEVQVMAQRDPKWTIFHQFV
jgi:hypothetical protein